MTHRIISDDITVHVLDKNSGQPLSAPAQIPTKIQSNWQPYDMA